MSETPQDEINALLARVGRGDRTVFSAVFRQLHGPVRRLCVSLLKNDADAADATQQAMAKVFERASDYDHTRSALTWALTIATWECRTLQRKRFRRREVPEDAAGEQRTDGGSEEAFVRRNLTEAALVAMNELPEIDRETLLATFLDESAPVQGATLRKRRERAIDRLRASFRRLYGID